MLGKLLSIGRWVTSNPTRMFVIAAAFAVTALAANVRIAQIQRDHARAELRTTQLALENQIASDSVQIILWKDSTVAVLKLNQQVDTVGLAELDSLREENNRLAVLNSELALTINSTTGSTTGTLEETDEGWVSSLVDYEMPFTLSATIRVVPESREVGLDWAVLTDPASLRVEVACEPIRGSGINRATTAVITPEWLQVSAVTWQIPELCNPLGPVTVGRGGVSSWLYPLVGAAAGAAASVFYGEPVLKGAAIGGGTGLLIKVVF